MVSVSHIWIPILARIMMVGIIDKIAIWSDHLSMAIMVVKSLLIKELHPISITTTIALVMQQTVAIHITNHCKTYTILDRR